MWWVRSMSWLQKLWMQYSPRQMGHPSAVPPSSLHQSLWPLPSRVWSTDLPPLHPLVCASKASKTGVVLMRCRSPGYRKKGDLYEAVSVKQFSMPDCQTGQNDSGSKTHGGPSSREAASGKNHRLRATTAISLALSAPDLSTHRLIELEALDIVRDIMLLEGRCTEKAIS